MVTAEEKPSIMPHSILPSDGSMIALIVYRERRRVGLRMIEMMRNAMKTSMYFGALRECIKREQRTLARDRFDLTQAQARQPGEKRS